MIAVTTRARVGNCVIDGELGVGDREAMVAAGMPLHISRERHVAADASAARTVSLVKGVTRGIDLGNVGLSAVVAAKAERIA